MDRVAILNLSLLVLSVQLVALTAAAAIGRGVNRYRASRAEQVCAVLRGSLILLTAGEPDEVEAAVDSLSVADHREWRAIEPSVRGLLTKVRGDAHASVVRVIARRGLIDAALADLTLWGLATGAGFIVCTLVVPTLVRRLGLLRSAIAVLAVCAVAQLVAVAWPVMWVLFVASFFIGLGVQSFKICIDTVVQAHVGERFKGRVFTFYDVGFNFAFVLAAVIAALTLPDTGISVAGFGIMALAYVVLAAAFALVARRIGAATFEKGTEDLTAR